MKNRSVNRARKRRTPGRPELNDLFRAYLRKFPRTVRRELRNDPRKRALSESIRSGFPATDQGEFHHT